MANASGLLVIERILRDRQGIWQQVVDDRDLTRLTGQMLISSMAALAVYGAVLGSFHSVLMALTSAVKLPLLFAVTLAICLPTLYLFNLVFGARLSVRQSLSLVMVALTVTAMLALAFAPISLFFLITAPDYGFFKLLNVAILGLAALVGLRFLTGGMRVLNDYGLLSPAAPDVPPAAPVPAATPAATPAPAATPGAAPNGATPASATPAPAGTAVAVAEPAAPAVTVPPGYVLQPVRPAPAPYPRAARPATGTPPSMTLLYVWIFLFGFVGTQLAWTLRPFFGSPGMKFSLYREIDGNFYAEIFRTISGLV
ncbi:hypothetical protein [Jidongwangia harbinensis]|uniref:hypothetical protein n=1 Tax=Jidongwangia harbinensis TaxID=2878561 RepID=UPI001CD99939|nr:hypothetical protein [Jidongwangia harbinensis]MCA2214493.1 hypothetical protein [Jidongwangia harbinensis]